MTHPSYQGASKPYLIGGGTALRSCHCLAGCSPICFHPLGIGRLGIVLTDMPLFSRRDVLVATALPFKRGR